MDLDAFSAAHRAEWTRLRELARMRRLSGAHVDELIALYQSGSAQLAAMTSVAGRPAHAEELSLALSRARTRFTGTGADPLRRLTAFFLVQLPAALYRVRWITLAVAGATIAVAVAYAVWIATTPGAFAALGSDAQLRRYAESDFVSYYSDNPEASFAGQVWTNNAWIAAQCVAFGITGVWVPYALLGNAQGLGQSAAVMAHYGRLDHFFLYIAPHGQLELYSVFTAAAAGLLVFWSWIAPGARRRSRALAEDGRALFTIVVGLVLSLLVSGIIEGFVTRQDWPWAVKIGIGTVALAAFACYQWLLGGRAARAGQTGDLDEFAAGARVLVAG